MDKRGPGLDALMHQIEQRNGDLCPGCGVILGPDAPHEFGCPWATLRGQVSLLRDRLEKAREKNRRLVAKLVTLEQAGTAVRKMLVHESGPGRGPCSLCGRYPVEGHAPNCPVLARATA